MENSKQELSVQSLATLLGATVAWDLVLFNGELVVICKLLSRYNPAEERGRTLTIGGSRRGRTHVHKRTSLVICANSIQNSLMCLN